MYTEQYVFVIERRVYCLQLLTVSCDLNNSSTLQSIWVFYLWNTNPILTVTLGIFIINLMQMIFFWHKFSIHLIQLYTKLVIDFILKSPIMIIVDVLSASLINSWNNSVIVVYLLWDDAYKPINCTSTGSIRCWTHGSIPSKLVIDPLCVYKALSLFLV